MLNSIKTPHVISSLSVAGSLGLQPLHAIRYWLNHLEIQHPVIAHIICRVIPVQCPFERNISLWGGVALHIPPLCKLNPLYEEVVGLRFRALCYLADECNIDIRRYC